MSSKRSRVHPKFKTKYRVTNWPEYDRSLVGRGDMTLWLSPESISGWNAGATGRRGGQQKYAPVAIETALTLRLVFKLPLRQTEGFLNSLFELMGVDLSAPDHTTLSRRGQHLDVVLRPFAVDEAVHLIVDSTGLSIVGEGEWAAAKHGRKGLQGWKKLHLGVDAHGVIVAQVLTDSHADDAKTGVELIQQLDAEIASVTADAAYDMRPFYNGATDRGASVVIPPIKTARVGCPRSAARDRTVGRIREVGRRQWKKEAGYHRQARVENTFFRYKTIIGGSLRARGRDAQVVEARLACNILNRLMENGRPASVAIGR